MFRNTSITFFFQGLGTASGVVLDAVILAVFGMGTQTDAFLAALALPMLISGMFEVQGTKVLVPLFSNSLSGQDGFRATRDLLSNLLSTSLLVLGGVCMLAMLAAEMLISIQVPGLSSESLQLSAHLNRILIWLILLRGLAVICSAALYARHRYVIPSCSKALTNLPALLAVFLLYSKLGIDALAVGLVLGALIQLAASLLALASQGFRYRPICRFNDPQLKGLPGRLGYLLGGEAMVQGRILLENFLVSFFPGGSLSALRYANRIVQGVSGVLVGSVITTSLPLISESASRGRLEEMKGNLLNSTKLLLLIAVPFSIWLIFASRPLVSLLFERGAFTSADAATTSAILALLTPYILLSRINGIFQIPFYASMDMRTPLAGISVALAVHLGIILTGQSSLGIFVFPIASSGGSLVSALIMGALLKRRFGAIGWRRASDFVQRLALSSAVAAVVLALASPANGSWIESQLLEKVFALAVPSAAGLVAFSLTAFGAGLVDWRKLWEMAAGKAA